METKIAGCNSTRTKQPDDYMIFKLHKALSIMVGGMQDSTPCQNDKSSLRLSSNKLALKISII